jgi:predicted dehydrogenase
MKGRESVPRVSVVGFGKMGILHGATLNLLKPGCVMGIVDHDRLVVHGASRLIRNIKFYRTIDQMLERVRPDAVYDTGDVASQHHVRVT